MSTSKLKMLTDQMSSNQNRLALKRKQSSGSKTQLRRRINNMENKGFGIQQIWNKSLERIEKREPRKRDNIWASELGKSPIDVFLKMRAVELTNPPNARSLRKFEAGNVFEWIVSLILKRAGILKESQKWSSFQYDGLVEVTGKADFIVGGKPDIEKWEKEMALLELPDVFMRAGEQIVKYLVDEYPNGMVEQPIEIKSVSAFMFEAMEHRGSSLKIHRIQTYHYLKSMKYRQCMIVYICRDDLRMMEYPVLLDGPVEQEYRGAIEEISKYHLKDERPPLAEKIVFDEDLGKFAKNFNVAYSGYLKMLYGFKDQKEFDDEHTPIVARWNRVIGRIKNGDKMTSKNEEAIEEMKQAGFNVEDVAGKSVGGEGEYNV